MSKKNVLHGSTKKQIHTQGQERVNCLKIEKRDNWAKYLTQQCKNTSSEKGHCWRRNTNRCDAIHKQILSYSQTKGGKNSS
jgi:hypothetical protein